MDKTSQQQPRYRDNAGAQVNRSAPGKLAASRRTGKYAPSSGINVLLGFRARARFSCAFRSTSRNWEASRIKNIFTSERRAHGSMRNVYVRVLKNSSPEILGNPIFSCSTIRRARYRDTRSHETRGDVVEIECEPREELREAERQTHTCIHIQRERASEREAVFYEGGWVRNRVEYGRIYLASWS